jgi:hypothetical protein
MQSRLSLASLLRKKRNRPKRKKRKSLLVKCHKTQWLALSTEDLYKWAPPFKAQVSLAVSPKVLSKGMAN